MPKHQLLVTIFHPLKCDSDLTKDKIAHKLKNASEFQSGTFFKGTETNGGNSLGGDYSKQKF